ncbi:hypothetical protein AGMMS50293_15950 [Spirochaetia bacterium]|nr:hypothetical protein AGMMS50293_15950 [Spirochaetia bacterium]
MRNHESRIPRLLILATLAVCLSSCTWGYIENSGSLDLVPIPYRWEFSVGDDFTPRQHLSVYQRAGSGSLTPIPLDKVDISLVNAAGDSAADAVPVSADSSYALLQAGTKDVLLSYHDQSVRYTITVADPSNPFGGGGGGSGSGGSSSGGGIDIGMTW